MMGRWDSEQDDLEQLEYIRRWKEDQAKKKQDKKSWKEKVKEIFRRRGK